MIIMHGIMGCQVFKRGGCKITKTLPKNKMMPNFLSYFSYHINTPWNMGEFALLPRLFFTFLKNQMAVSIIIIIKIKLKY